MQDKKVGTYSKTKMVNGKEKNYDKKNVYQGKEGGLYYMSPSGRKVYVDKDKKGLVMSADKKGRVMSNKKSKTMGEMMGGADSDDE